jgi:hypothetical protein
MTRRKANVTDNGLFIARNDHYTNTHQRGPLRGRGGGRTSVYTTLIFEIINSLDLVYMTRICHGLSDAGLCQKGGDLQRKVSLSPAIAPETSLFNSRICIACQWTLQNSDDLFITDDVNSSGLKVVLEVGTIFENTNVFREIVVCVWEDD